MSHNREDIPKSLAWLAPVVFLALQCTEPVANVPPIRTAPGFQVDLVFSVPQETQGSWVSLCADGRGNLYASDQYGPIFRITPAPPGSPKGKTVVKELALPIGGAHGLSWIDEKLYVMVGQKGMRTPGLYRISDTDEDGELDLVETLYELDGEGEHGPHTVLPGPDGRSIFVMAGDGTRLPDLEANRVPRLWANDSLVSGSPALIGSESRGTPYGGWICRTDLEAKRWELVAMGLRNAYDLAMHPAGELFTFDSDTEFDINLPWYRPTRVLQVVSGADFGWRGGSFKVPESAPDNWPSVISMGLGSPTGMTFGYGTKLPVRYQQALWVADWSYGKLHALHLKARGAGFSAEKEEIVSGTPLPITSLCVNEADGAIYFTTGGRRIQSRLYRLTGTPEGTAENTSPEAPNSDILKRRELERFHRRSGSHALDALWPHLGSEDVWIRNAARVALEHMSKQEWEARALQEAPSQTALSSLLALARLGGSSKPPDLLDALAHFDWQALARSQRGDWLRIITLAFIRGGDLAAEARTSWADKLNPLFPTGDRELDPVLLELLIFLQAPGAEVKGLARLENAITREEQIAYAVSLRAGRNWTESSRKQFFEWLASTGTWSGGRTYGPVLEHIRKDALEATPEALRLAMQGILNAGPTEPAPLFTLPADRGLVKNWSVEELVSLVEQDTHERNLERGRKMFAAVGCFTCHRVANEGGVLAPDLTAVSGRFGIRDLIEAVVEPSKAISDQYGTTTVTLLSGESLTGRIVNLTGDQLHLSENLYNPADVKRFDAADVVSVEPSDVSLMPEGMINVLEADEILDLLAWLLSGGG